MSSPQPISQFVQQEILPRLAAAAAFRSVRFSQESGRFWRGICPFHQDDGSSHPMYVDSATLRWSCLGGCRKGGQSFLAFLNDGGFPHAGSGQFRSALQNAADLAGVPPSQIPEWTIDDELRAVQEERVASLLETFFLQAHLALHVEADPSGQRDCGPARSWLEEQGFDLASLDHLAIGLFVGREVALERLLEAGFIDEEIRASALVDDPRLAGRLVGPIRDRWGRILSFWALHPEGRPPRFLFKGKWKEEAALFGLDEALHSGAGEEQRLLVVERLLDALLLHCKGLRSAAAVGGPPRELGRRRWQRLSDLGVRRLTLAFDREEDGCRDILTALENAFRVRPPLEVFVLPPKSLRGYGNPAEMVRAEGPDALEEALENETVHAFCFEARMILEKHSAGGAWTDAGRHAAWKEAIEFYASQARRAVRDLDDHFVPTIVAGLDRTWDTLQPLSGAGGQSQPREQAPGALPEARRETPVPAAGPACPAVSPAKRGRETCPIHHCEATSCFCFD